MNYNQDYVNGEGDLITYSVSVRLMQIFIDLIAQVIAPLTTVANSNIHS